jgi:hypothetical protein
MHVGTTTLCLTSYDVTASLANCTHINSIYFQVSAPVHVKMRWLHCTSARERLAMQAEYMIAMANQNQLPPSK